MHFEIRTNDGNFVIRQAVMPDLDAIRNIWLEGMAVALSSDGTESISLSAVGGRLRSMINAQDDNFRFWVCVNADRQIAAWSCVQPIYNTPLESLRNSYALISTYVAASERGKGLGSILVSFVRDFCRDHTTIDYIMGFKLASNTVSTSVCDRTGFYTLAQLPNIPGRSPMDFVVCTTGS